MKKVFTTAVITALLLSCSGNQDQTGQSADQIDSLKQVIRKLSAKNDSLERMLTKHQSWFYPASDGRAFLAKGINDPLANIKQALRSNPELIPLEPVLGGTMHFTNIKVLGENWVVAMYEDGHVMGKSLYSYELQPDTTIQFQLLISSSRQ